MVHNSYGIPTTSLRLIRDRISKKKTRSISLFFKLHGQLCLKFGTTAAILRCSEGPLPKWHLHLMTSLEPLDVAIASDNYFKRGNTQAVSGWQRTRFLAIYNVTRQTILISFRSGQDQFILKDVPKDIFSNFNETIRPQLHESPFIRLPCDDIPNQQILVYKYLKDDFLSLVKRGISMRARKQILKGCLLGIAELHDRQIVHLGTVSLRFCRPGLQELTDYVQTSSQTISWLTVMIMIARRLLSNRLRLSTLRMPRISPMVGAFKVCSLATTTGAVPRHILKARLTNRLTFSLLELLYVFPHFYSKELFTPTGLFSHYHQCIYASLGRVIFGPDEDFQFHQSQGALPAFIRLQRQVSYFGDQEGICGLSKQIADDGVSCEILQMLWDERSEAHVPYKPFSKWPDIVDPSFRDLVLRLTNLDPVKRITAREALEHPWLADF